MTALFVLAVGCAFAGAAFAFLAGCAYLEGRRGREDGTDGSVPTPLPGRPPVEHLDPWYLVALGMKAKLK